MKFGGRFNQLNLVEAFKKHIKNFKKIKGLVYKNKSKIIVNAKQDNIDLNKLPLINYDLVDIKKYMEKSLAGNIEKVILYQSSRGCPYRCSFCINAVTGNQKYRKKSAKKVLDEIEILIKKYNANFISFVDDNFFVDIKRVEEICKGIIKRKLNINWFAECRANYFKKNFVDEKFLKLAKKSGLKIITIGAESGSERILKIMKKDVTVNEIITSGKMLNKHKIIPVYSFILGIPEEKKEDVLKTVKLINKLRKICPNMVGGIGTFRPYPRCELSDLLINQNMLKEPKTLREWYNPQNIQIYTARKNKQAWQFDADYLARVLYYTTLLISFNEKQIKKEMEKFNLPYFAYFIFFYMAKVRCKLLFFDFPVDLYIYKSLKKTYKFMKTLLR